MEATWVSTWMKDKEVAEFFHVSTKTVRRWALRGMPRIREGSVVLYAVEDCEEWLRARTRPAFAANRAAAARRPGRPRRVADL